MQDVAGFLQRRELSFQGYFDPTRPAVIDGEHLARVNYESYLFADESGRSRFLEDPVLYCGLVTDPVSKRRFRPRDDAPRIELEGVLYLFESEGNLDRFCRDTEAHVRPGHTM